MTDEDAAGEGRVLRGRHARLSESAIREIAEQIARAMPLPPPEDRSTWILSRVAELPVDEEERVVHALSVLRRVAQYERPR